jgi:hypothetical protein
MDYVNKLIKYSIKLDPHNGEIKWIKERFNCVISFDSSIVMNKAKDMIWHYRKEILNRDEKFFMDIQPGKTNDKEVNELMDSLIHSIKEKVPNMEKQEKVLVWETINNILVEVAKYKKITSDHW